jgi:hypothetical protein
MDSALMIYDRIYIGTGVISVLDAVHHSRLGQSVLMIDNGLGMGGAWRSLDAFGLHDVENAIHYLLPEREAVKFMRDVLGWRVEKSPRKYRIFALQLFGRVKVPYDSLVGRAMGRALENGGTGHLLRLLAELPRAWREVAGEPRDPSYYVEGGSPEILSKTEKLLELSQVETEFATEVRRMRMDPATSDIVLETSSGERRARAATISHGLKLTELDGLHGRLDITQQVHPRPAAHLLVHDDAAPSIYEAVFTGDPLIKYAHDVTRFTREGRSVIGKLKVIVLALRHQVKESDGIYAQIFDKLRWGGMVGPKASLEDAFWSDVFLPTIDDNDLSTISAAFGGRVDYLRTENSSAGIGYYAPRWSATMAGRPQLGQDQVRQLASSKTKEDVH